MLSPEQLLGTAKLDKATLVKWFSHDFLQTLKNQLWRLLSGPALLLILPLYLNAETQGYWFTFVSLAALAVFADLGFTMVILQWSAHEFAQLSFNTNGEFAGNSQSLKRISSLFVFSVKWAGIMVGIAFPIIFAIGYVLLSQKSSAVIWHLPWFIYCASSVLVFFNNLILSFFEGCNSVGKIQKARFNISVAANLMTIAGVITGFGLYALTTGLLVSAFVGMYLIYANYANAVKQMLSLYKMYQHPWKKDLLPLLWRYAISWASGYFIFQLFTPTAFHYFGAATAGRVGLSITAWMAIYGIANIWLIIIIPTINIYVAHGDYLKLNILFKRNILLTMATYLIGAAMFFLLLRLFGTRLGISQRLVGGGSLAIIAVAWFLQIIINAWAIYIRAHKQEPLVMASFAWAIYISLTTWMLAAYWPIEYYFIGYLSSYILILPWFYKIFIKYKREPL